MIFSFILQIKFMIFFSDKNNIDFNLVLLLLISFFFLCFFCQSFYDFLFYPSNQVYDFFISIIVIVMVIVIL